MDTILYDLFFGDLRLSSDAFLTDPNYLQAKETFAEEEAALLSSLSGPSRNSLLRLLNAHSQLEGTLMAEYFVRGYHIGGRLAACLLQN